MENRLQELLDELRRFDAEEGLWGEDFLKRTRIEDYNSERYLLKISDVPATLELDKQGTFEFWFFNAAAFLTEAKVAIDCNKVKYSTRYFKDWMQFWHSYYAEKANFFLTIKCRNNDYEVLNYLVKALSMVNGRMVVSMLGKDFESEAAYDLFSYLGARMALHDLGEKYLTPQYGPQKQFELSHMVPAEVIDYYGNIDELGEEFYSLRQCLPTDLPKGTLYKTVYMKMYPKTNVDHLILDKNAMAIDILDDCVWGSFSCGLPAEADDCLCDFRGRS